MNAKEARDLVKLHGGVRAAARAIGRSHSWVQLRLQGVPDNGTKQGTKPVVVVKEDAKKIERLEASLRAARGTPVEKIAPAAPVRRAVKETVRVVIPDTHGDHISRPAAAAFLADLKRLNPDEIVMLGDHLDCGGFLAQHHTMGFVAETETTFESDVKATNAFLDEIQKAAPRASIVYLEGNHECVRPDTDVLTAEGWKPITEVTTDDTVASLKPDGTVVFDNPTGLVRKKYVGDMVEVTDGPCVMSVTPNHRVLYQDKRGKLAYMEAVDLMRGEHSRTRIPTAGHSPHADYPITDDEIRLTAWILTDGHVNGHVGISQSKPAMRDKIRALLDRMGLTYAERVRERDVKEVCGVRLKNKVLPTCTFDFTGSSPATVAKLVGVQGWTYHGRYEKRVPSHFHQLSDRQFEVFLHACMDGDGTWVGTAACLYGLPAPLSDIQALCATHGYRAHLANRTRNGEPDYWCLNITKRPSSNVYGHLMQRTAYSGLVYCLVMPETNFCVRYKGKVHFTGNCRVERWCVTSALRNRRDAQFLLDMFGPPAILGLKNRGIDYVRTSERRDGLAVPGTIRRGKCFFTHGIGHGVHATHQHVTRFGASVVHGHTHRQQSSLIRIVEGGVIGAWCPGTLSQLQPLYAHTSITNWSHGYGVQFVQASGEFMHINVTLVDGRSLLPSLVRGA